MGREVVRDRRNESGYAVAFNGDGALALSNAAMFQQHTVGKNSCILASPLTYTHMSGLQADGIMIQGLNIRYLRSTTVDSLLASIKSILTSKLLQINSRTFLMRYASLFVVHILQLKLLSVVNYKYKHDIVPSQCNRLTFSTSSLDRPSVHLQAPPTLQGPHSSDVTLAEATRIFGHAMYLVGKLLTIPS